MNGLTELYNSNFDVMFYCILFCCLGYAMADTTFIVFRKKFTKLCPVCVLFDIVFIVYLVHIMGYGAFPLFAGFVIYFVFYGIYYYFKLLIVLVGKIKPIYKLSNRIKTWLNNL